MAILPSGGLCSVSIADVGIKPTGCFAPTALRERPDEIHMQRRAKKPLGAADSPHGLIRQVRLISARPMEHARQALARRKRPGNLILKSELDQFRDWFQPPAPDVLQPCFLRDTVQ
jgi:hypothetical protein